MRMALEGIRVIEWGLFMQAPVAARILGSLGAEVIKIEDPRGGDPARGIRSFRGASLEMPDGRCAFFENHNRNKKGIAVDLKKPKGREIIYRLVEKSDIFMQNWRPGLAERLDLGYETLRKYNPRLIYGSGSGYGPKGPLSRKPAVDVTAQARAGIQFATGEPGSPPVMPIDAIADDMGCFAFAFGLVVALYARDRTGIGQKVDASLFGSTIRLQRWPLENYLLTGNYPGRVKREEAHNPLYNQYQCKDGKWLILAHLHPQKVWPAFCKALGIPQLEKDPRFEDAQKREENRKALISILDQVFATRTYEEWQKAFDEAGEFIYSPINQLTDLASDPQATENRYIDTFNDPFLGPLRVVGLPFLFSETPWADRSPAPGLGQHTEEVLTGICGYSREEVAELKNERVI